MTVRGITTEPTSIVLGNTDLSSTVSKCVFVIRPSIDGPTPSHPIISQALLSDQTIKEMCRAGWSIVSGGLDSKATPST